MKLDVLVFDMDGVLVDVTDSYRESIRHTVRHFSGHDISPELIQGYKNAGGWNNDWALSQKICADLGYEVSYESVVRVFQDVFFGTDNDGLMLRERWIAQDGLLERLAQRYDLAIFTGRLREEVDITLERFAPGLKFAAIISDGDVPNAKPAPDGLFAISRQFPAGKLTYIGDTVDDARSARAAAVGFVGIAHRNNPRYGELTTLLEAENALVILDSINQLETVL